MKKSFVVILLLLGYCVSAQKIKDKNIVCAYYQYPLNPVFPGNLIYSYYITESPDEFTTNKTITYSSMGRLDLKYSSAMSNFFSGFRTGIGDSGQLRLHVVLSPFVLEKRKAVFSAQQNQQNMAYSMTYSYDLDFSLSVGVTLKTNDGRVVYHDTIVPKTLFHSNYPVNIPQNIGEGLIQMPGYSTQSDLENNFLNHRSAYLSAMKNYYSDQLLTTIKNTLNDLYTYTYTRKAFRFYTIRSKKGHYAELDTALTIVETAFDSISANVKRKDFRNWHTPAVKKMFSHAVAIWEKDLIEAETKSSPRFTAEHIVHLKHNLMYGYYFLNDYNGVRKHWNGIHNYPDFGNLHRSELDEFYKNLDKQEIRYNKNKEVLELQ